MGCEECLEQEEALEVEVKFLASVNPKQNYLIKTQK